MAVQIAKSRGAHVIATASAGNHDYLREIGAGSLRVNINRCYPLDSIAQAQEHNRSGRTRGKVVVDMADR